MSDVRGQLTADRQPGRKLMRFAQTGSDESFRRYSSCPRTGTKLIRLSSCVIAAVAPRYLPAFFPWRAVASPEGCFALARRSCFFRRLARFWALSLPLLCPISPTFARFLTESKASLGSADMACQTAKDNGRRWWVVAKSGGFFSGAKLSQLWR